MAIQVLIVGTQQKFKNKLKKIFSGNKAFEVRIGKSNSGEFDLESLRRGEIDLICFAGKSKDQDWIDLSEVRAAWEWMPVIVMVDANEKAYEYPEVLVRAIGSKTNKETLSSLALKMVKHSKVLKASKPAEQVQINLGGLATDFYDTMDIHSVLEKTLSHFGSKILCRDLHWIHWHEIQHLAKVESESLDLELETKYHRTPIESTQLT